MYMLQFTFDTITNAQAIDALVHSVAIDLWLNHSIDALQTSAGQLAFEHERDRTLALLACSSNQLYTVQILD